MQSRTKPTLLVFIQAANERSPLSTERGQDGSLRGMLLSVTRVLLAVGITGCVSRDSPVVTSGHPRLSLVEVRSIQLPIGSAVRGADISAHGDVLYWSDSSVVVVSNDSASGGDYLCRGQLFRPVSAAFAERDSAVEIVDAGYRSVYRATVAESARASCSRSMQGVSRPPYVMMRVGSCC